MLNNVSCSILQILLSYMFKVNTKYVESLGTVGPGNIFNSHAGGVPPKEGTTLTSFSLIDHEYCNGLDIRIILLEF